MATNNTPSLQDVDERSREIFRHIVDTYLASGEPVGSRNISKALPSGLSAASVRNVMADLEGLGLIYSPHTSAGRMPTETGLRFFIDSLMEVGPLNIEERNQIEQQLPSQADSQSLDDVLAKTGSILSGLTGSAGLVLAKKQNSPLKHVEFVRLDETQALVVLVNEDGQVENRVLPLPAGTTASALSEATNYLNARIRGNTLDQARLNIEKLYTSAKEELDDLTQRVVEAGIASWVDTGDNVPPTMIVRGQSNLLDDMSAQNDLERIRRLFDDLEAKKDVMQLLQLAEEGDGVRIFIGSENSLFSLSGSSLVISPYKDQDNRVVGALGIIGPTRLNYARIIPTVDFTAQLISRMLR
ncbi:MAG: heat-inducible transcriptional repressor HrcA [Hyphomicrobiales bacterium]